MAWQAKTRALLKEPLVHFLIAGAAVFWLLSGRAPDLAAVWTDPEFDPGARAFYYVRVLMIPTPTWIDYDMVKFHLTLDPQIPLKQQERGYTSAIWYNPV